MPPVRYAQQVLLFPLYRSLSPPPISAPTSVRGLATAATTDPLFRNSLRKPRTTGVLLSAKITEMQKESLSDSYDRSIGDAALLGNLNETD